MKHMPFGKWMNRCIATVSVILWYAVIFGFSAQDGEESGSLSGAIAKAIMNVLGGDPEGEGCRTLETVIRKGAHMTEFAILMLLLVWALYAWTGVRNCKTLAAALCITVCLAALDEYHQTFVEGRAGRPLDVLIDTSGALLCACIIVLIAFLKKKRENHRQKV